jgi:ElaA protein
MEQISEISWTLKSFNELTLDELYDALQLRQAVFCVEQNCAYQDVDGKDKKGWHLLGYQNKRLMAYSRLLPAGVAFAEVSIGRVITRKEARMTGAGKELMRRSVLHCEQLFGHQPIRIGAQQYLKRFYEGFGFKDVSKPYLEDDIPHLEMVRSNEQ